jgi:hypothetical protein
LKKAVAEASFSAVDALAARLRKPIFGLNCARPENTASGDRYQ